VTRRRLCTTVALLVLALAVPASARAAAPSTSSVRALAAAEGTAAVQGFHGQHPGSRAKAPYWDGYRWVVDYDAAGRLELQVTVSSTGRVLAVWKGLKARASFTRGRVGGLLDSPWVLVPFSLLFLVPFVDPRRPFRLLHVDLLVLLSFGLSYWFLNGGMLRMSIVLVYPVLLYLLARMLWAGFRPRAPAGRLVPHATAGVLVVGLMLMVGARIGLNLANHKTFDIAYASVVGADRVWHKQELYVEGGSDFDTYGPLMYAAYVPFERAFPWEGEWDYLPAAHAAAIAFDLLTLLGLILLGRRLRAGPEGTTLGLALAWAWAAFPFTLAGLLLSSNDGLVALLLVYALVFFFSAAGRGALLGAATAAKFLSGALLPLVAAGLGERDRRRAVACAVSCLAIVVFAVWLYLPHGGLREFWDCTLGYQLSRPPDFSLWGIEDGIGWTRTAAGVLAAGLALVVALLPRRRSLVQASALAAAVTIAFQIPAGHWFYFYIVWFMPLLLVALFGAYRPAGLEAGGLDEQVDLLRVARAREEDQLVGA
jgi:hypothetical protein